MTAKTEQNTHSAWRVALWLMNRIRAQYLGYVGAALVFAIVTLAPGKLFHYFTAELPSLQAHPSAENFLRQIAIFGALIAVCTSLAVFLKTYLKERLRLSLECFLRREVVERLHHLPSESLRGSQRGEWLTKMTADIKMTEEFLGNTLPDVFYNAALAIGTCCFLAYYSGSVAIILVLGALLSGLVYAFVQKRLVPVLQEMRSLHALIFQLLLENLEGWRTIRSFDALENELGRVENKLTLFRTKGLRVGRLFASLLSTNEFITQVLILLCLVTSAWAVLSGQITVNEALIYPFYLGQFFYSVRGFINGLSAVNRYQIHGERLGQLLDMRAAEKRSAEALSEGAYALHANLTIRHAPKHILLQDFELTLETGKVHALLGPSGAGKSSILDVLAGLRSFDGHVELLRNGEPHWKESGMHFLLPVSLCAYVEQKPFIFEGSLRENLSMGRPISDPRMWKVLDELGLTEIFGPRGGLDTLLSDRGQNMSEGQLYRVAIARAVLSERPFLLLDEPFAALDRESVRGVIQIFETLRVKRGLLVVTHQIPSEIHFDQIYRIAPASQPEAKFVSGPRVRVQKTETNGGAFPEKQNLLCHFQGGHDVQ